MTRPLLGGTFASRTNQRFASRDTVSFVVSCPNARTRITSSDNWVKNIDYVFVRKLNGFRVLTSAFDDTVRLWDVNKPHESTVVVR